MTILQSHRFWLIVAGLLIALAAVIGVIVKPEAQDSIIAAAIAVKALLGIGVYSDGTRRMGDHGGDQ